MRETIPLPTPLRAQPRVLSDGVIEIKCTGQLRAEDAAYLPQLAQIIASRRGLVTIVFDTLELESYSPNFPLAHIAFFKEHRARIDRIAVAHELKSIAFAVATIALASQTCIKGFPSMNQALGWLRSSSSVA